MNSFSEASSGKLHFIGKLPGRAVDRALDNDRRIAFAGVASDQYQLLAFEQVGQRRGIELGRANAAGELAAWDS